MTPSRFLDPSRFAALRGAGLSLALLASASLTLPAQADEQETAPATQQQGAMDHSQMDHSKMEHPMDHSSHSMHGMHEMHDMQGQDHSAHMKSMSSGVARTEVTYALPDVTLTDMNGTKVRLFDELDGPEPVLINFIFTTCTAVCPISSSTFAEIQHDLIKAGKPFRLISISIDPEEDTPARLREYAARYEASKDWHFLTGSLETIISVQRAFDAYRGNKMNHPPLIFIRADANKPWVRFEGFVSPDAVVEEYDRQRAATKVSAN